ncbi:MAG TPA: hypothetical protein PL182_12160 [Pseudobdellovibrionaceae bacterium]|nr:hypothetical protein [Pseudobdellovibrionaceae bacterium]
MNRTLRFLIVCPALLFGFSASAQGFVKTVISCSTQSYSSGDFGGSSEGSLIVEVQEVQYPKAHTMTVSQYQNQQPPSPGGGWGGAQDPWPSMGTLKILSHEVVQIKTNGTGKETVISGRQYEVHLNFFRQTERYPAFLIVKAQNIQIPLHCSFN